MGSSDLEFESSDQLTELQLKHLEKYTRFQNSGITFIVPFIQKLYSVNITEQLVDVMRQEVITKDNLNCTVDAQVYFKVGSSEPETEKVHYIKSIIMMSKLFNLPEPLYVMSLEITCLRM